MASLKPLIAAATTSGRITQKTWEQQLEPLARQLPKVATPEARAILDLWSSDTLEIDPAARTGMRDFLTGHGYPMPPPAMKPYPALVPAIDRGNVTTPDALFEHLVAASGRPDAKTLVAVLDSGVELDHPALTSKVHSNPGEVAGDGLDNDGNGKVDDVRGWNFVENSAAQPAAGAMDTHGTHVAGLATQGTERIGLIPLRVTDRNTHGATVADAIDYAVAQGARVVNMSLNVQSDLGLVRDAMARHPDVLFVASAGNQGTSLDRLGPDELLSTIRLPNLVVVGASNREGWVDPMSNYGASHVDLAANGTAHSTVPGGYGVMQGTSMAAPAVSSVAAKCLALDPSLDPETLKSLLSLSSRPVAEWVGKAASGGVVDEPVAIELAALRGLVGRGIAPAAAAEQLGLTGAERVKVLALLERLA